MKALLGLLAAKVGAAVRAIYLWSSTPGKKTNWRSWLGHTLLLAFFALAFGPNVGAFGYFVYEVAQWINKAALQVEQDWGDNINDLAIPYLVVGVGALLIHYGKLLLA